MKTIFYFSLLFTLFAAGCKPEQPDPQTYFLDPELKRYFYNPYQEGNYWIFHCEENDDYDTVTVFSSVRVVDILGGKIQQNYPKNWGPENGDYDFHEQTHIYCPPYIDFQLYAFKDYTNLGYGTKLPKGNDITKIFPQNTDFYYKDTVLFGKTYQNCYCYNNRSEHFVSLGYPYYQCFAPDLGIFSFYRNDCNYKLIDYHVQ